MSAEQPYTDEAMKDALMTELALCLFNDLTVSETTGRVWAVITAAMAEKDAALKEAREDRDYWHQSEATMTNQYNTERAAHEATKAELQALREAIPADVWNAAVSTLTRKDA